MHWPEHTSQILAVLSNEAVINLSPSVLKCKLTISAPWPAKLKISCPVSTSQSLAVWSIEPVATNIPWGSKERQTISILCPLRVWQRWPVFASQILAVLSNDPVTILSLYQGFITIYLLLFRIPIRIIESHSVDDIFVFIKRQQFLPTDGVPYLARSIVAASDEPVTIIEKGILLLLISGFIEGTIS